MGTVIAKSITSKIKKILNFSVALSNGDLSKTIEVSGKDEIDEMSRSLNKATSEMANLTDVLTARAMEGERSANTIINNAVSYKHTAAQSSDKAYKLYEEKEVNCCTNSGKMLYNRDS